MVEGRDDAPGVLIFRKRLLPYSETFIASQGQALKRYRPLFVGLERHEQGLHYLKEGTYSLLQDHASSVGLARLPMHLGMKPNARWLRTLRAHKPQLIHVHFGNGVAAAMPLAKALEIPMLVSWHGHDISKPLESGFRQKVRRAIAMADHHIAVSSYIADRLLEADCPQSKMTLHHIGVPISSDPVSPVPQGGGVLFVGRLVEKKGLKHLIAAMAILKRAGQQAALTIIGDGPLRGALERQALDAGVAAQFLGKRSPEDVRACMVRSTLVAGPSIRTRRDVEGLGMVFVEAQALGRPVVGFRSGGIADAIDHGTSGVLVAEGDEEALAREIGRLLSDPALAMAMGAAGAEHARNSHNLQRQTIALESLYKRIVARASP